MRMIGKALVLCGRMSPFPRACSICIADSLRPCFASPQSPATHHVERVASIPDELLVHQDDKRKASVVVEAAPIREEATTEELLAEVRKCLLCMTFDALEISLIAAMAMRMSERC